MGRSETNIGTSKTDYGVEQKQTMPRRSDCCHSCIDGPLVSQNLVFQILGCPPSAEELRATSAGAV